MTAQSDRATAAAEKRELRKMVRTHKGNRTAIAAALTKAGTSITRQGVSAKLSRFGLLELADKLSQASHKPGPRDNVSDEVLRREREELLDALATVETYDQAPAKLGIGIATMYRRISRHAITPRQVAARRKQLA